MNFPSNFITNQDKLLKNVIENILPSSQSASFLAGFFYFSGFYALYRGLEEKKVKILIGMDIEKDLHNAVKEVYHHQKRNQNIPLSDVKNSAYGGFASLAETDFLDSKEGREAWKIFVKKIQNNTLEIRKTKKPNHAKLYIFENKPSHAQGGEFPGTVITGSSNLTLSGLERQFEINVSFRDAAHYREAKDIFDALWSNDHSVAIADAYTKDEFTEKVIKKIWIDQLPSPYLVYLRVLIEYFGVKREAGIHLPHKITNQYIDLQYQKDAIIKALDLLEKHNGAIIADVVGLGKSIIASAVAYNKGAQTIIIAPTHLKRQWQGYVREFHLNGEVYGSSSIHKALKDWKDIPGEKLIIVDEAHAYRNELTMDYQYLHQLCQGNKVLLLSATPFNNAPQDIFSMIKLFQIPVRSTIRAVNNLSHEFRTLIKEYKNLKKEKQEDKKSQEIKRIAERIRILLEPVVIRRSRLDLRTVKSYNADLQKQGISFPVVEPPKFISYDFGELEEKYVWTLDKIVGSDTEAAHFTGARYKPTAYLKNREKYKKEIAAIFGDAARFKQGQKELAGHMKNLLVKRLESSPAAFRITLQNMIGSMEKIKEWYYKEGRVPIFKKGYIPDVGALRESTDDRAGFEEKIDYYVKEKKFWFLPARELKKEFIRKVESDITLLSDIQNRWFGNERAGDAASLQDKKLEKLKALLAEKLRENPSRKIVIFSEYADTVEYAHQNLRDDFSIFKYTSLYATEENKETISANFDAGIAPSRQKDEYRILLATDAISEGFNLHRAGVVINYDIPYNPTRVIQRVGRINRINKKVFDTLYIYNFFPSLIGEREIRIKDISTLKIAMINALLGSDTKVLTQSENLETFYAHQFQEAREVEEELSWDVPYKNELDGASEEAKRQALDICKRAKIKRESGDKQKGALVFAKKGEDYIFSFGDGEKADAVSAKDGVALFYGEKGEKAYPVTDWFWEPYEQIKSSLFFKTASDAKKERGWREVIDKLRLLLRAAPNESAYIEDLLQVTDILESLIEAHGKYIRSLYTETQEQQKQAVEQLKKRVPHEYLAAIIRKANEITEGGETLIVAEEF